VLRAVFGRVSPASPKHRSVLASRDDSGVPGCQLTLSFGHDLSVQRWMLPPDSTEMPMDGADMHAQSSRDFRVAGRITPIPQDRDRDATLTRRKDPLEPPPEVVELRGLGEPPCLSLHHARALGRLRAMAANAEVTPPSSAAHDAIQSRDCRQSSSTGVSYSRWVDVRWLSDSIAPSAVGALSFRRAAGRARLIELLPAPGRTAGRPRSICNRVASRGFQLIWLFGIPLTPLDVFPAARTGVVIAIWAFALIGCVLHAGRSGEGSWAAPHARPCTT
jgi:hypothetical protein